MKCCFKCHQTKPINDFYAHPQMKDGHLNKCKECAKKDQKATSFEQLFRRSEYERMRNNCPKRRAKKRYYEKLHRQRNPEKDRARQQLDYAVRKGKICKGSCEICGEAKVQAHHEDYSKPLDVKWLCFTCHREVYHSQIVVCDKVFATF